MTAAEPDDTRPYRVDVSAPALRSLNRLPARIRPGILAFATDRLATAPSRIGHPLRGRYDGDFTAVYGQYRVRYEIDRSARTIVILRFDHRSDAYGR